MTNAEIRKGEYVRTIDGYISKVKEATDDWIECESAITKHYEDTFDSLYPDEFDTITKHSFNLIDLIEVGDYVNGIEVEVIGYDNNEIGELVETLGVAYVDDDVAWRTELKDIPHIYAIVTKEQFKAMEYKVGGENDKC